MCGCPASCKLFSSASGMRSGAVMCQASNCGVNHTAGRHGDTRIRCKSTRRALSSWSLGAFPNPDQTDAPQVASSDRALANGCWSAYWSPTAFSNGVSQR